MSATTTTEADLVFPPTRSGASDGVIDTTPFLSSSGDSRSESMSEGRENRNSARRQSLREAARLLRPAGSGGMMREPSMLVRETAAEQLEERQSDWAYSKPVVVLDIVWNVAFVAVAAAVMVSSRDERPNMPLRVWVFGYSLQSVLHMACVCVEYRRRRRRGIASRHRSISSSSSSLEDGSSRLTNSSQQQYVSLSQLEESENTGCYAKHLESANTMFSFIWWIIGFYWVSAGGQTLAHSSPQLYWLCIVFLGFDVFFVIFCVALACVIGLAVCCCLPCIIAILYAVADQEGVSREDIDQLPKFKFQRIGDDEKLLTTARGIMRECGTDSPIERALSPEDAECCICLCEYEEGVELRELPCGHHFHCTCVDKWLHINSRCPLCKYNISRNSNEV